MARTPSAGTTLLVMPMCHANSLYFAFTFAYLGATCVIDDLRHFDPELLLKTLSEQQITFTSLVPTHFIMMLDLPAAVKNKYDVDRVRKLMISSAPARRDTKLAIMAHFRRSELFELYGSTEAGWVTLLRPHEQLTKLGSVGREWTGSGPIRLLDAGGNEVADGEVGETVMDWSADVSIAGRLASVGARLIEGTANKMIAQSFDCIRTRLEA